MGTSTAKFESAGDSPVQDDLIGSDAGNIIARKYTLSTGENVVRGEVLGLITATGKVAASLSAANDGSETPFGIAATDANSSDGDDSPPAEAEVLVYTRGSFNEHALTIGTAHTVASIREGLRDKGIYLETPVKRYP